MILIPTIPQPNHEELRYCLRLIEIHHPEQEVTICGYLPEWLTNVNYLPFNDSPNYQFKARNIYNKIVHTFEQTGVDDLLFFNDDHFIFATVDYYHHKGKMTTEGRAPNGTYTALLRNTMQQFPNCNDFDTHCPIWYNNERFKALSQLDWTIPHGYGIKTSYCTLNGIEGEYYPDLKFRDTIGDLTNRLYFSTSNETNLLPLKNLLTNKSKFEK